MPFCSQCGSRHDEGARFCGSCGGAVAGGPPNVAPLASFQPVVPPVVAQSTSPQKVAVILPNAKKMKMMGLYDTFAVVLTQDSAIFAKLTNEVMKDVIKKSQEQSKAEGKGMFARIGAQMKAFYGASNRYLDMQPEQILAEDKNNFALPHASVGGIKLKRGMYPGDEDGPGDPYIEIEWESASGKFKFRFDQDEKDLLPALNQFYPGKIRK